MCGRTACTVRWGGGGEILWAYPTLIHRNRPYLIDLPQTVEAHVHPDPYPLLRRAVLNLTRYFAHLGLPHHGEAFAQDLFQRYRTGRL